MQRRRQLCKTRVTESVTDEVASSSVRWIEGGKSIVRENNEERLCKERNSL